MPKPGPLSAIEADPEFRALPPDVQRRILADAQAAPTRPTPQPAPAPTPAKPSRPPLMLLAAMDPKPADPIAPLANEKRRRLIPADLPQRASLIDEARAVMPEFPGERPADVAARNRRLATPPIPGTKESAARATREIVTENLLGGVSGGMMLAPNYQENLQRALPPQRQPIPARPPLVTPQAADPTTRERAAGLVGAGLGMAKGMYNAIEGPIEDVVRDPSRLYPLSEGFLEGAMATPLGTAALAVDPAGGYGFGLAGLGAKAIGKGAVTAARGANLAAGDFAGRLGQAVTPAIEAAIPRVDAAFDFLGDQMKARPSSPLGRTPAVPVASAIEDGPLPPMADLIAQATEIQRAAPGFLPDAQMPEGARRGSLRIGRPASDAWTPAQQAANRAIERKIRELVKERKAAEEVGNAGRVTELDAEIQGLDDARVVIPKPGQGPVTTIADLQAQQAAAATAGDTATVNRLDRQIRRMRASNYHNPTKYDFLGPESVDKFTGLLEQQVAELRAAGRDPRQPVPFSAVRRQAQEILPFALEQIGRKGLKKGESLTAAEYEAAKNYMQQLVEESVVVDRRVHAIRAAQNNGPVAIGADGLPIAPENLAQALTIESARAMQLDKDALGLMEIVTQSRSQKGRDLAYLKMVAQQSWDPAYWLARADRTSGGTATSAQIGEIGRIVIEGQQAEAAGNAAAQRQARIDLAQAMGRLTVTPWLDALLMARKAGLLSGFKTIARNTSSNTLNLGLEEMVNVMGVVPDAFLSMATGRRTVFAREAANIGRAVNETLTRGIGEARETMLYGMPLDQLAALDIPSEVNSPSRALNTYVNTIMRFQGAQDRLFKAYALRRSLDSQARSLALDAARAPGPRASRAVVDAHARYLADNPTEAMMMEAIADAEFATFQNETAISKMVSAAKRGALLYDAGTSSNTGRTLTAVADLFLPFVKTPASIGARVLDYTIGTGTYQAARRRGRRLTQERAQANNPNRSQAQRANTPPVEWMTREEQRAISKGLSRQAIGATLIWYGQRLFEEGRLTGTDQMDRREENAAAGRISNAIKVGDEWVPLNPFSPVGNLLTLGATMARDGAPDGQDAAIRTATQVLALMLDQPFTQGMKQAVEVAGDTGGRKMNRFAAGVAGSVVPSLVNEAAMFLDSSDEARAIDYSSAFPAAVQSIQARTPIIRETGIPGLLPPLPTRYTGLGDAQDANTGWRALAAGAGRFARENYDPMVREILTTGASLPRLQDDVQLQRGEAPIPLTLPEQQELLRMRGSAARQGIMGSIGDPTYGAQMPDVQRDLLDRNIKGRSAAALNQFLTPEMRAILLERQAQASDAERSRRGRGRAVVGPLSQP